MVLSHGPWVVPLERLSGVYVEADNLEAGVCGGSSVYIWNHEVPRLGSTLQNVRYYQGCPESKDSAARFKEMMKHSSAL